MTNHLEGQSSPYLLQHAQNPVDWYPWGSEALSRAKTEGKPIFLSIGYAACHWCHVMAHESFEDQTIADFLNQNFISIKVDREERPDLDGIYMASVVALSQQGGWPMSVFLTPDLRPFYGGTYFPSVPRHGLPAFLDVIKAVHAAWMREREQVVHVSDHILEEMQKMNHVSGQYPVKLQPGVLTEALNNLLSTYDWAYGGWGRAPKFPQPMLIEFLLRQAAGGNRQALDTAVHALDAMRRGGMYDIIGGGFHRYSTDTGWLVPHFEKMLYDNAQLASVYLHAYLQTGEERFLKVCTQTLDFMLREMRHAGGGFYSSIDADSDGAEGRFYTWTLEELSNAVNQPDDFKLLQAAYDLSEAGNFEGRIILHRRQTIIRAANEFGTSPEEFSRRLENIHLQLRKHRDVRVRPMTDDKILASWNGLALNVFAEAGRYLDRDDYLQAAHQCARFITANMTEGRRLYRSWRDGKPSTPAFLEDYASLILGLLALYQADGNVEWYSVAESFALEIRESFRDPEGGFFDTPISSVDLPYRPKDVQDNATPGGSSLAARALQGLSPLTANIEDQSTVEKMLGMVQEMIAQYPAAFGSWLLAFDLEMNPNRQIAVVWETGANKDDITPLLDIPLRNYRPRTILAFSSLPLPAGAPELLADRPTINGEPTAYVCHDFICSLPVTSPEDLRNQLE